MIGMDFIDLLQSAGSALPLAVGYQGFTWCLTETARYVGQRESANKRDTQVDCHFPGPGSPGIQVTTRSLGIQWYGIPFGPTNPGIAGHRAHHLYAFHQVIDVFVSSCLCSEAGDNIWFPGSSASGADTVATGCGTKRRSGPSIGFLAQLRTPDAGLG